MNPSAAAFLSACDQKGVKYHEPRVLSDGKTVISLGVNSSHGNKYTMRFFFSADGTQVSLRIFGFVPVRQEIFSRMLLRCNTMNNRYSWVKFTVDADMDLNLEADFLITPETAGHICAEMLCRVASVAHDAYPYLVCSNLLPEEAP